ncbi:cysteine-rich venom protein 1-like [Anopheles stephensi]|uniref:cysteine-rich venom protein 1-like n=1 Tax=Anopheles stephensi TaxID=30069 RepID=UPI001658B366|nr:cysteine-rich venom protein 1-like [Anopheles stephensi]
MKTTQVLLGLALVISLHLVSVVYAELEHCGVNEKFEFCGPVREASCLEAISVDQDLSEVRYRRNEDTGGCVQGCFCEQGYIRQLMGGQCIRLKECLEVGHHR